MKHFIIVGIGPVQDFIASARKSRDLWFGSWLLSELSRAAAKTIVASESNGTECLIFPHINSEQQLAPNHSHNIVNKIVAEVTTDPNAIFNKIKTSHSIW